MNVFQNFKFIQRFLELFLNLMLHGFLNLKPLYGFKQQNATEIIPIIPHSGSL